MVIKIPTANIHTPQPIMKFIARTSHLKPGTIVETSGNSPYFKHDVLLWCDRMKIEILNIEEKDHIILIKVKI